MMTPPLELACKQIEFARGYTKSLLQDVEGDDWFRCPTEATTHLAWQIGHLAMAEYGLCLFRIRGRQPEDLELMSGAFRRNTVRAQRPIRIQPAMCHRAKSSRCWIACTPRQCENWPSVRKQCCRKRWMNRMPCSIPSWALFCSAPPTKCCMPVRLGC